MKKIKNLRKLIKKKMLTIIIMTKKVNCIKEKIILSMILI